MILLCNTVNSLFIDTSPRCTPCQVLTIYPLLYYKKILSKVDTYLRLTADTFPKEKGSKYLPEQTGNGWSIDSNKQNWILYVTITKTTCVPQIEKFFVVYLTTRHMLKGIHLKCQYLSFAQGLVLNDWGLMAFILMADVSSTRWIAIMPQKCLS